MGTHRQRFLYDLSTLVTLLCREARVDSNHSMTSSLSLFLEDSEKRAPTGVQDAFCKVMVFHHSGDSQVLNGDVMIGLSILFSDLEMMVAPLAIDLQVRLSNVTGSLAATVTAFLAATQLALFASQGFLRRAIEAGVLNRLAKGIRQKGLQPHINADVMVLASGREVFGVWFSLTDDERIPVPIRAMNKMHGFGSTLYRTMELDLEKLPQLRRNMQMFVIDIQPHITGGSVLPELNRVPAIRLFEPGEPDTRNTQRFSSEKPFERLGEAISKHLYGGGWHVFTTTALEPCCQIVLRGKRALVLILCFHRLQHLVIDDARFDQALHEQMGLFLIHEKTVFKRSHSPFYNRLGIERQQCIPPQYNFAS